MADAGYAARRGVVYGGIIIVSIPIAIYGDGYGTFW